MRHQLGLFHRIVAAIQTVHERGNVGANEGKCTIANGKTSCSKERWREIQREVGQRDIHKEGDLEVFAAVAHTPAG